MRLAFAGTPEFAERALAALQAAGHEIALVLTQPDRPSGRGQHLLQSAVKQRALRTGVPVYQPESLRSDDAVRTVRDSRPDALIVAAYGALLPPALLDIGRFGALNIHASLLPRWRGAAPIQRALLAGDRETGVSIMRMDAGLDTGPVLVQRRIDIVSSEDAGTLHDKLASIGASLMVETLTELASGRSRETAQPSEGATYARKISKEEANLVWSRPAAELERVVRAFRPAPGAAARHDGEALKIWSARVVPRTGAPGIVLSAGESIVVACGDAALEIGELQRAGARRMPASSFLHGHPVKVGSRFE